MVKEIWSDFNHSKFKPYYQVSNTGRVRNKITNKYLKLRHDNRGYVKVALSLNLPYKKNTQIGVHRLVALTYIPNDDPENKTTVNHKDYDKDNNCVENLEWMSNSNNVKDSYTTKHHVMGRGVNANSSKYTEDQIVLVCELLQQKKTPKQISVLTDVPENIIGHIKAGKIWSDISNNYNIPKPEKRNKYEYLYDDIDDLILKGYNWKDIRKKLNLPKDKPTRDLIFRRIKKVSSSSTTIEQNLIIGFK